MLDDYTKEELACLVISRERDLKKLAKDNERLRKAVNSEFDRLGLKDKKFLSKEQVIEILNSSRNAKGK